MAEMRRRTTHKYEAVRSDDGEDELPLTTQGKAWRFATDRVYPYLWSVCYVAISWLVADKTNFIDVVQHHPKMDRFYFNIGAGLFLINCAIAAYAITVQWIRPKKDEDKWEEYMPNVIPLASLIGVFCSLFLTLGFWPVFGFLTPVILTILFVGSVHLFEVVPGPWW